MAAVAGQDRIAWVCVHRPFRGPHDAGHIRESDFNLALQFSRLDMLRMAKDLRGETAVSATTKYQRIASFVILLGAGIIHNKQPAVGSEWDGLNDSRALHRIDAAALSCIPLDPHDAVGVCAGVALRDLVPRLKRLEEAKPPLLECLRRR
ncbi:MAG TPA: hypothetical protein VHU43_01055 [Steroidobacteraceae bacterium]|nr:hypothetical protein [Steroidobacteraceae bacterium]